MANIRLSGRNIAADATLSVSPALVSGLGVENLLTEDRWQMARSTYAPGSGVTTAQQIKLSWSGDQSASMVWLRMINFTTAATVQVQHYSDSAWTTQIYDSTALAAFSASGLNTSLDDHTSRDFRHLKNFVLYYSLLTTIRSTKISILDAANPDGYVEASGLGVAQYIEPAYNPAFGGVQMMPGDASVQGAAADGTVRTHKRYKARKLAIDLEWIHDDDLADLLAWVDYMGLDKQFFVDLYPEVAGALGLRHRGVFKLQSIEALTPHNFGLHRNSLPMIEA